MRPRRLLGQLALQLLESTVYIPPSTPQRLMFDFYVLSWCATAPSDPTDHKRPASFITKSRLKDDVDEAFDILTRNLQQHLLGVLYTAILGEWCHFGHRGWYPRAHMHALDSLSLAIVQHLQKTSADERVTRPYIGDTLKDFAPHDVVKVARGCFLKGVWRNAYGGKAWASICDAYFMLERASTTQHRAIAIDHVYDIQHNTGTVFNKIPEYSNTGYMDGYGWIKKALDQKSSAQTISPLLLQCSSYARRLGYATLKMAGVTPDPHPHAGGNHVVFKYPPSTGLKFLMQHPGWDNIYTIHVASGGAYDSGNDTRWTCYVLRDKSSGVVYQLTACGTDRVLTPEELSSARVDIHYNAQYASNLRSAPIIQPAWDIPGLAELRES